MAKGSYISWLNQKIANFLGDFKEERKSEQDPNPTRAVCRIVFVLVLMVVLLFVLVYHLLDSPNVRVQQIHHLQPGGKNYELIKDYLYNKNYTFNQTAQKNYSTPWRRPVVCPCSNISVSWRDFVSFYVLSENSSDWNMSFVRGTLYTDPQNPRRSPIIFVPAPTDGNITLLKTHLVKANTPLTVKEFCDLSNLWPWPNQANLKDNLDICFYIASMLLPGADHIRDTSRSAEILETPILLNREIFRMRIAERARESILKRRLRIDMVNRKSSILRIYYNGMADFLTGILDRNEMEEWLSYYIGAVNLQSTLESSKYFQPDNPMVFSIAPNNDTSRSQYFLHPEVDWVKYYNTCSPQYCEETKRMTNFQQLIRAFGLLGGVATVAIGFTSVLLWPVTGLLLRRFSNGSPASVGDSERPQAAILMSTAVGGKLAPTRLSHQPYDVHVVSISGAHMDPELHRRTIQQSRQTT